MKFNKGDKVRPNVWRAGPDPINHEIYCTWATTRAQAHFRDEPWDMTWQEYQEIWRPHWHRRGRKSQDLCLTRVDLERPWCVDNVELITRRAQIQRRNQRRVGSTYAPRKNTADGTLRTIYKKIMGRGL